ncbi:hypothetical protein LOK49_LG08G01798 [Camellia lanceoleosa]|uniref:Uncharacterized protein n=1 Tax=Camellia lanceoleosa TaxID=1840588 RepID=A0ACC0GWI9_9ERIC|nr:hypothetical protein LOK49_LG08G01798 [Camellia lanceoleosa]
MVRNLVLVWCFLSLIAYVALSDVVLVGNNMTLSFKDVEASFALPVTGPGECGTLSLAEPLDACSALSNKGNDSAFVLVIRGQCSFEGKVRIAQAAGFKAAIIYDNVDGDLLTMAGFSARIKIHAVFVSKASGKVLTKYAGVSNMELWITPSSLYSGWSIVAAFFISFLGMLAALATCFFVQRYSIRQETPRASHVCGFYGMSKRHVKAIPSIIFTADVEDNCTSATCAICLEDYSVGEKLRILPCHHKFHATCVDGWLTTWRTFCPICKRDARTSTGNPRVTEHTPLLSSSPSSSVLSSSFRSSLPSSSAIQIAPQSPQPSSVYRTPPISPNLYLQQTLQTYRQSPYSSASQSSLDLRNVSSQRFHTSHLLSPHSMDYRSVSLPNSRYMSPNIPSPGNVSSFSPFDSAQSLPEC